jgi:hypothetical protein
MLPMTINPITFWLAGIITAAAMLYAAYTVQKRYMAR